MQFKSRASTKLPIHLIYFWDLRENLKTQKKPTHIQGEHAKLCLDTNLISELTHKPLSLIK